jgi:hypothetical protein
MSLTLELDPSAEQILNERAREARTEPGKLAAALLTDALRTEPCDYDEISPEEMAEIKEAIKKAEQAFADGRYKTLEQLIADKRERFGIGK